MGIFSVDRFWKFILWLVVTGGLLLPFLAGWDAKYWRWAPWGDKVMYVCMTLFGAVVFGCVVSSPGLQSLPGGVSTMAVATLAVLAALVLGVIAGMFLED